MQNHIYFAFSNLTSKINAAFSTLHGFGDIGSVIYQKVKKEADEVSFLDRR